MKIEPIQMVDMQKYLVDDGCIVIDLRNKQKYEEDHIPEAKCVPYHYLNNQIEQLKKYRTIILYCDRGNISLMAARDLKRAGIERVFSLYGGFDEYKRIKKSNRS